MTKKEAQEYLHFFAEVLARAGMFQFIEGQDGPLMLGGGRYEPFPCVDTDEDRLRRANRDRDQRDNLEDIELTVLSIQAPTRTYYLAVPRRTDDANIFRRATQLLEECLRRQRARPSA